jgi:hypothetical protein
MSGDWKNKGGERGIATTDGIRLAPTDGIRLAPARHPKGFCTLNIEDQMVLYALQQYPLSLSLATSPKFHPLKEYSLSFTALSKRFCTLYLLHLQQYPLNFILYINSATRFDILYYFLPLVSTCTEISTVHRAPPYILYT